MLFNFQVFKDFLVFLLLISTLNPLWTESVLCIISILFTLLVCLMVHDIVCLVGCPMEAWKIMCTIGWKIQSKGMRSCWLIVPVTSSVSSRFYVQYFYLLLTRGLQFPALTVELSVSPFGFIGFSSLPFEALLFGAYTFGSSCLRGELNFLSFCEVLLCLCNFLHSKVYLILHSHSFFY